MRFEILRSFKINLLTINYNLFFLAYIVSDHLLINILVQYNVYNLIKNKLRKHWVFMRSLVRLLLILTILCLVSCSHSVLRQKMIEKYQTQKLKYIKLEPKGKTLQ